MKKKAGFKLNVLEFEASDSAANDGAKASNDWLVTNHQLQTEQSVCGRASGRRAADVSDALSHRAPSSQPALPSNVSFLL